MFKNLLNKVGWGDLPSSFGFSVGEKIDLPYRWHWELREGKKKSDGSPVSVFVCPKQDLDSQQSAAAKNSVQMAKSLRHTHIIRAHDSIEVDSGYYLVTEPVKPLLCPDLDSLDDNREPAVWGLYQVFDALGFLHQSGFTHGLVGPGSVFVTPSGDYRLGSFDLCCKDADASSLLALWRRIGPGVISWPEPPGHLQDGGTPTCGVDLWGAAVLLAYVYASAKTRTAGHSCRLDMSHATQDLPKEFQRPFAELSRPGPLRGKMPIVELLQSPVFLNSSTVCLMQFLTNVSIKSDTEKDQFFDGLPALLDSVPISLQRKQVLPQLLEAQKFAGPAAAQVLPAILKIGTKLNDEEFRAKVAPLVCQLFAMPDRAVRFRLLSSLGEMVDHLDTHMINDKIFPECVNGFTDSNGPIREATVKALIHFIPKLNVKTVEGRVLKLLVKLMQDPEQSIRTNAIICCGRISSHLSKAVASQTLLSMLGMGFRDPFPPCRNACLQTLSATMTLFSAEELAQKLMPGLCHRLIDPDPSVAASAHSVLAQLSQQVQELMEERRQAAGQQSVQDTQDVKTTSVGGWGTWALSTVGSVVGQNVMGSMGPPKADSWNTAVSAGSCPSPQSEGPQSEGPDVDTQQQSAPSSASTAGKSMTLKRNSGTAEVPVKAAEESPTHAAPGAAWGGDELWGDFGDVPITQQEPEFSSKRAVPKQPAAPLAAKPLSTSGSLTQKGSGPVLNKEEEDFWKEFDM